MTDAPDMETKPRLHVLILEDSPADATLMARTLEKAGFDLDVDLATGRDRFEELLAGEAYDVILADYTLPGFDARAALELAATACPETPFICVSGTIGEEATVELLKQGADDCVLKDRLGRLPFAVQRALDERAEARALRESEARYRSLFEDSPIALWEDDHSAVKLHLEELLASGVDDVIALVLADPQEHARCADLVRVVDANKAAVRLFEAQSREELLARNSDIYSDQSEPGIWRLWQAMLAGEHSVTFEEADRTLTGKDIKILETCTVVPGHEQAFDRVYVADVDITDRKAAEEANARLAAIVASSEDAIFSQTLEGTILTWNPGAERLLGYAAAEVVGGPVWHLVPPDSEDEQALFLERIGGGATVEHRETRLVRKDGTEFEVSLSLSPIRDAAGVIVGAATIARDVTERRFREREATWAARLVSLADPARDLRELMADLTAALQSETGCEAVGIRLRAGEDYPYFEARGFPPEHLEAEDHLCAYGADGQILRDEAGNPLLECMCGNILCGRFDPAQPFFSARGSFWTNSTTALLASTSEADRQARTRDRCNGEGYESVALVPLRSGEQVFGLLQFNDHRADRFTAGMIAHLERMGDSLTEALSRREAAAALRSLSERQAALLAAVPEIVTEVDDAMRYTWTNAAGLEFFGEDVLGREAAFYFVGEQDTYAVVAPLFAGSEAIARVESLQRRKDGEPRLLSWQCRSLTDGSGNVVGALSTARDITEQQRATVELEATA